MRMSNVLGQSLSEDDLTSMAGAAMEATGGHPEGHGRRSAVIGLTLGEAMGAEEATLTTVRHGAQIEAAGCPSNDALTEWLTGLDPSHAKRTATTFEPSCMKSQGKFVWQMLTGGNPLTQLWRLIRLSLNQRQFREFAYRVRCTAGTQILRDMGYSDQVVTAVDYSSEHWDGSGAPYGLRTGKIPLASQLILFGRFADSVAYQRGAAAIQQLLDGTHRGWFSPEIKRAYKAVTADDFWLTLGSPTLVAAELERRRSSEAVPVDPTRMSVAANALADMQGQRDPYTAGHQNRVADIAVLLASILGLPADEVELVRLSAQLHDVGKLRVKLKLLLKKGKLDQAERRLMEVHPTVSRAILWVPAFEEIAAYAGAHHEKYDGGASDGVPGYPHGLRFPFGLERYRNPLIAAIVTMADVIDALISERPYRAAMPIEKAYAIIVNEMRGHFHPQCLEAMQAMWQLEQFLAIVQRCAKANEDLVFRMPKQAFAHFKEQQRKARAR